MMMNTRTVLLVVALVGPAALGACAGMRRHAWVERSNTHARILLDTMARFAPEQAASLGIEGHDGDILDLRADYVERQTRAIEEAGTKLDALIAVEKDAR